MNDKINVNVHFTLVTNTLREVLYCKEQGKFKLIIYFYGWIQMESLDCRTLVTPNAEAIHPTTYESRGRDTQQNIGQSAQSPVEGWD